MANREVSVAICGAVVGIILGAGSLSFSQDVSLSGSVFDVIRTRHATDESNEITKQRNVNRRLEDGELGISPVDVNDYPTVKDKVDAPKQDTAKPAKLTICGAVQEVIAAVTHAHDAIIPKNVANTSMRSALASALQKIGADMRYCHGTDDAGDEEEATTTTKTTKKPAASDPCKKYALGTTRYTLCALENGSLNQ